MTDRRTERTAAIAGAPLEGIRVLDLSRVLAGPWCTQLLADFGAEVVKVERPGVGDDSRTWGPGFYEGAGGRRISAYFCAVNRNKRSVSIDMTDADGAIAIARMAAESDVVVENFKVGGLARYGLDYATLSRANPRLVYCSITGYGQSGPYAERPGYDSVIQGVGGLMSVSGLADDEAGGGPMKVGVPLIDVMTGLYASNAILIALRERDRSGAGQHIDLSLLDVNIAALSTIAAGYLCSGQVPRRRGNENPACSPADALRCRDGYVSLIVGNDSQFRSFSTAIGEPGLAGEARFLTNEMRIRNRDALMALLRPVFERRTRADWLATFAKAGVPCGPINDFDDLFADPHVQARGPVATFDSAEFGPIRVPGNPIRMSRSKPRYEMPPIDRDDGGG